MSATSIQERTIDVQGLRTRYLTAGAGSPVVLLPGGGARAGGWAWVLPTPARENLVYAIDLPGYDGSSEPSDYAPAFTAHFVGSFLEAVGVERAVVVANSFGGLTALRLALSEPERVHALVLADSAGLGQAVNPTIVALSSPEVASWRRPWPKRLLVPPRGRSGERYSCSRVPGRSP